MNFSAAASRSPVVTPGRIFAASRSMVRTRMSPARAILSISAGDFLTIIALSTLEALFETEGGQRRPDVVMDLDLVPGPVEPAQQSAFLVVVLERLGLLMVRVEPLLDRRRSVVVALVQRLAALVAAVVVLGRVVRDVVQVAVRALPAAGEPFDDHLVRRVDGQRRGQLAAELLQLLPQRVRLRDVAREAVQQEAVVALVLDLVEDHLDHELVGNELAVVHVRLGLAAQVRLLPHVLPQEVARGDVGQIEVLTQACRLRALTGPGRTEENQVELAHKGDSSPGGRRGALRSGDRSAKPYFKKPS